jgi:Xaa-Pro dipeptidase
LDRRKAPLFPLSEYEGRWTRVLAELERRGLDILLVTAPSDLYWLCGYDSFGGYQFQSAIFDRRIGRPVLLVHEMEEEGARATAVTADIRTWTHTGTSPKGGPGDPVAVCAAIIGDLPSSGGMIGLPLDSPTFGYSTGRRLEHLIPSSRQQDASDLVPELRVVKSPAELRNVRTAASFADGAMEACLEAIAQGASELELLSVVQSTLNHLGSEYPAMPHVILSGARTIHGHQTPSSRRIETGDVVTIETIGVSARYHANVARTAVVGAPPPLVAEAAALAAETLTACVQAAGPGVSGASLDRLSRKLTSRFADSRLHRVGYGLEASYPPAMTGRLSCSDGDPRTLEAGMVISISPHLYFRRPESGSPFAILLGHDIVITESGAEALGRLPLELRQI